MSTGADSPAAEPAEKAIGLGRSVAFNVFGQAASLLIGFASTILLARGLGPSDRGLLALIVYLCELAVAVAGLGLPYAVVYYASRPKAPRGALLGNSLAFGVVLTAVFVPLFWLLRNPIADAFSHGSGASTWAWAGLLVPLSFLDWATHNQLFGKLRFGLLNLLITFARLMALATIVGLVTIVGLGVAGGLISVMVAAGVMIVGSLAVILPGDRPRIDLSLFRRMASYGARVQVGWIFQILNYRIDVLVVQFFYPLANVGYYVVAQIVAELSLTVASAFQTSVNALIPHHEGADAEQTRTTIASIRHQTILTAASVVGTAALGPLVILYAYGSAFRPALTPMLILLPGMLFLGAGVVVTGNLRGRGRPGLSSTLAGLTAIVTLILDLALIPPFGITGAAIASVIAYTFYGTASLVTLARLGGIPIRTLALPTRAEFSMYVSIYRRGIAWLRARTAGR
jgi:O-antigen/teichoic acid export membrane protein